MNTIKRTGCTYHYTEILWVTDLAPNFRFWELNVFSRRMRDRCLICKVKSVTSCNTHFWYLLSLGNYSRNWGYRNKPFYFTSRNLQSGFIYHKNWCVKLVITILEASKKYCLFLCIHKFYIFIVFIKCICNYSYP